MLFGKPTFAAALFAAASTALETHEGIDYEVVWEAGTAPETAPIKTHYETTAAKQAATRLHEVLTAANMGADCLAKYPDTTPADLYSLKHCVVEAEGDDVFFSLLSEDIAEGDAFWEKVVAESTKPRPEWISAKAYVKAYTGEALTAANMAVWMASPNSDSGYLSGNPEHYWKSTGAPASGSPTAQSSHLFEGWGGVLSPHFGTKRMNFTVPDFAPRAFGSETYPAEWAIGSKFAPQLQRLGEKTLTSGTIWGVLHIAVRDFSAEEGTTGKSGIEVYGAVWYPPWDQSSAANQAEFMNFLRDEDHQVVSEVVNFSLQAIKDCSTGACVPPTQ